MPRWPADQMLFDIILAPPGPVEPPPAAPPPFVAVVSAELVALDRIVRNRADRPFLAACLRVVDPAGGAAVEHPFNTITDRLEQAAPRLGRVLVSALWSVLAHRVVTMRPGLAATLDISAEQGFRVTATAGVIADIGGMIVPPPAAAWSFAAATIPVYAAHGDRQDGTLGHWQQWLNVASTWRLGGPELDAVIGVLTPHPLPSTATAA